MLNHIHQHPVIKYFLALTKYTCPFGWEEERYGPMLTEKGAVTDSYGNFYIQVGDNKDILFASHLDTAGYEKTPQRVRRQWHRHNMLHTDGKTILGADDKAGVAIMLYMIDNNVPGTYAFFVGEECGCQGSGYFAEQYGDNNYKQMVSFDRFGTESIITHQMGERCCSDNYATELANHYAALGIHTLDLDPSGTYTDSAEFTSLIPECTNLSVGYYAQHTTSERQDAEFLVKMAEASVSIPWEYLPIERDPTVDEYRYTKFNKNWDYGPMVDWQPWDDVPHPATLVSTSKRRQYGPHSAADILSQDVYYTIDELRTFCIDNPQEAAETIDALLYFRDAYLELN